MPSIVKHSGVIMLTMIDGCSFWVYYMHMSSFSHHRSAFPPIGTVGLTPPSCEIQNKFEAPISEADFARRQEEIARCLADFQARWRSSDESEQLAEVIAFPVQPDLPVMFTPGQSHNVS
jgi:hypothetical protein